jgi:hypothetical protein
VLKHSLSNKEQVFVRAQGLGYCPFNMEYPCNPLKVDNTKIICIIYEGDVPSI